MAKFFKVDELLMEIKETEAEVARWKEACELEVEAGEKEVEERDKLVVILKQELEKTKAALEISNGKLKLKEELATAAMAAQAAGERSLQLADSRAAQLRDRVEELTKQLEEAESRERSRRKALLHHTV
ncbi:putative ATP binding protein [Corchorus olitorius]|uniref:ATP binding protein n=1 Tax=Corchorus olitorius TaxID=93759 RepID=A0A1R3HNI9_9ROSI|nr:putative ATP binding protein [Corchorus olitorius]